MVSAAAPGLGRRAVLVYGASACFLYGTSALYHRRRWTEEGWRPFVLDVRKPHEAEIVTLPHVDRLHPHDRIAAIASELPADRDVLVFCRSGVRSAAAAQVLLQHGLARVFDLDGGVLAWVSEVDPRLPTY